MKNWTIIKTVNEYNTAISRTYDILDAEPGTPEFDELELLTLLIEDYEDKNYHLPVVDPVEVIKLKMEEKGLKSKDLVPLIGSKGHVSQVLNKKRELTLQMARALHKFLNIPSEIFMETEEAV